jgi:hypothetical protein
MTGWSGDRGHALLSTAVRARHSLVDEVAPFSTAMIVGVLVFPEKHTTVRLR